MGYSAIIKVLRAQADAIDRAIAHLESLNSPDGPTAVAGAPKRRGRKLGEAERQQVSERMRRYWAKRQKRVK